MTAKRLTIQKRKEIFLALVAAQDAHTMSVIDSQKRMMQDFSISEAQLEEIIEEGMEKEWLDELAAA